MLKRKAPDDQEGGSGKKGCPSDDTKTQLIPRSLPPSSITIHFKLTTWEEFAPGRLYYLPTCVTPKWIVNGNNNLQLQLAQYLPLAQSFEIHTPEVKLSNLIFLQDDLRVQSNTPTDATAFTQVCYLMHFCPTTPTEYFKLGNLVNGRNSDVTDLEYELQPNYNSAFTQVGEINYTDFTNTLLIPAYINRTAGWNTDGNRGQNPNPPYNDFPPYISPMTTPKSFGETIDFHRYCSHNLQANASSHFLKPNKTIGFIKDMDKTTIYKYGDTIHLPIETNLEGQTLARSPNNYFWTDQTFTYVGGGNTVVYQKEFYYPGNNRPFLCRCTQYDPYVGCILHNKSFKKLKHHFITMPPIRKPNGALLGQRCSAICEQTFAITINFDTSHWNSSDEPEKINVYTSNSDDVQMKSQIHKTIVRNAIYGNVKEGGKPPPPYDGGPLCPYGMDCSGLCDFSNDWYGLMAWLTSQSEATVRNIISLYEKAPEDAVIFYVEDNYIFNREYLTDFIQPQSTKMADYLVNFRIPLKDMYFKINATNTNWYCFPTGTAGKVKCSPVVIQDYHGAIEFLDVYGQDEKKTIYVKLNHNALDEALAKDELIVCRKSAAPTVSKTVSKNGVVIPHVNETIYEREEDNPDHQKGPTLEQATFRTNSKVSTLFFM